VFIDRAETTVEQGSASTQWVSTETACQQMPDRDVRCADGDAEKSITWQGLACDAFGGNEALKGSRPSRCGRRCEAQATVRKMTLRERIKKVEKPFISSS
jgi:hypothetical protein